MLRILGEMGEKACGANLVMERKGYRGIEFNIHRLDDWRWEWMVYTKSGEGARVSGCIDGAAGNATAAAKAAIDGWLAAKSN